MKRLVMAGLFCIMMTSGVFAATGTSNNKFINQWYDMINGTQQTTIIAYKPNCTTQTTNCTTQATTQVTTEISTETTTQAATQKPTQATTQVVTEKPTQATTQAVTQKPTQATTQVVTEKPTQATTQAVTQKPTQATTQVTTQKPTQATTQSPTVETSTESTTQSVSNTANSFAQQVLDLVNAERAKNGLTALTLNTKVNEVAQAKAEDMKNNNYFSHTSPTYGTPFDMLKKFGVTYKYAGENIAKGQQSPQQVVTEWLNSDGHRKNILSANYKEMGLGYSGGYWAQIFIG